MSSQDQGTHNHLSRLLGLDRLRKHVQSDQFQQDAADAGQRLRTSIERGLDHLPATVQLIPGRVIRSTGDASTAVAYGARFIAQRSRDVVKVVTKGIGRGGERVVSAVNGHMDSQVNHLFDRYGLPLNLLPDDMRTNSPVNLDRAAQLEVALQEYMRAQYLHRILPHHINRVADFIDPHGGETGQRRQRLPQPRTPMNPQGSAVDGFLSALNITADALRRYGHPAREMLGTAYTFFATRHNELLRQMGINPDLLASFAQELGAEWENLDIRSDQRSDRRIRDLIKMYQGLILDRLQLPDGTLRAGDVIDAAEPPQS